MTGAGVDYHRLAILAHPTDRLIGERHGIEIGMAHPRRFGLACHIGPLAAVPTIDVAKSRLLGRYAPHGQERAIGRRSPTVRTRSARGLAHPRAYGTGIRFGRSPHQTVQRGRFMRCAAPPSACRSRSASRSSLAGPSPDAAVTARSLPRPVEIVLVEPRRRNSRRKSRKHDAELIRRRKRLVARQSKACCRTDLGGERT
jgi:Endonuclease V